MRRSELEHVIRAACGVTGATEVVIIGSQAVLGLFPCSPESLLVSVEADVFTFRDPKDSDLIDGSIGERSLFHQSFGYYAHGVAEETATLPSGWKDRLIRIQNENTGGAAGLCLEVHDLAVSKLVAGREKDVTFIRELLTNEMIEISVLAERLSQTELPPEQRQLAEQRLNSFGE